MYEINLGSALFAVKNKEVLMTTGSHGKTIGTYATAGIGLSKAHTGSRPAKYNAAGKALDYILYSNAVKCLDGDDCIYAEFSLGSTSARVLCNGSYDSYEGERLHGSAKFVPLVLYYLRSKSESEELKECYRKIKENVTATGEASLEDVARFCYCFYYTIAAPRTNPYGYRMSARIS